MPFKKSSKSRSKNAEGGKKADKPAAAQPDADVAEHSSVTNAQSVEAVQTLLLSSLSCLAYLRGFFAESCFDDRVYESDRVLQSYRSFANGVEQHSKGVHKASSSVKRGTTSMKVLMRGRHPAVDTALQWLETGVFDALKRAVLQGLQINVFEHQDDPSKAMETYTFTLKYSDPTVTQPRVAGLQLQGPQGVPVTMKNVRHGVQMFIRRLITLCSTLPDLPKRRFLTMHIFYTDECDPTYDAPGFRENHEPRVHFPSNESWRMSLQTCGALDSGHHNVGLKVSHLVRIEEPDVDEAETAGDGGPVRIPQNLEYSITTLRADSLDKLKTFSPKYDRGDTPRRSPTLIDRISKMNNTRMKILASPCDVPRVARTDLPGVTSEQSVFSPVRSQTQLPTMTLKQGADQDMARICPDEQLEKLSETQTSSQHAKDLDQHAIFQNILMPPPSQHHSMEATQTLEDDSGLAKQDASDEEPFLSFRLPQKKIDIMERRKNALVRGQPNAPQTPSVLHTKEDVVECECGYDDGEGDMMYCGFCEKWQHMHCYGYRGRNDKRVPPVHACYRCLLQGKEDRLMSELKDLVLLRRAIYVLAYYGYVSEKPFAEQMRTDVGTAKRIAQRFKAQKVLVDTPGSHKRGFGQTGKPKFKVNAHGKVWDQIIHDFYAPLAKIAHLFDVQSPARIDEQSAVVTPLPNPPRDISDTVTTRDTAKLSSPIHNVRRSPRLSQRFTSQISQAPRTATLASAQKLTSIFREPPVERKILKLKIRETTNLQHPVTPTRKRTLDMVQADFVTPSPKRMRHAITIETIDVGSSPISTIGTQYEL